ncbi:DsbA family protein [Candidatus Uhrbacteria bacterium]|nr:DsbA family protein [Candidatus Uhrbacteria bacterium]
MHRSTLFLLCCAAIGAIALIALWPPRAPAPIDTSTPSPSLVPRPSSLFPPLVLSTDPIRGKVNAPLTIVAFGDYTCPTCADIEEVLADLRREYGERLRIVWKDFPVLNRLTGSRQLHIAARCSQPQGRFWEYHDALFAEQPREPSDLIALAERLGLDRTTFARCLEESTAASLVDVNTAEAQRLGLTTAPTIFVNDTKLTEAPTYGGLRALLDVAAPTP